MDVTRFAYNAYQKLAWCIPKLNIFRKRKVDWISVVGILESWIDRVVITVGECFLFEGCEDVDVWTRIDEQTRTMTTMTNLEARINN